jgi:nucleoside-diphosphate-sugar epimerase
MNVFLAGASGVVGRPCVKILVARGHRVFAMTRRTDLSGNLWEAGAIPVVADAMEAEPLRLAMRATQPDVAIHQLTDLSALRAHPDEALQRNAALRKLGTANLVAAALAAGVPKVVAQSIAWIYGPGREPLEESAPLDVNASGMRRVSVDGVMSLEGAVLTTAGLRGCVLRYGQFYGPGTPNENGSRSEISVHVEAAAWAAVLAAEKSVTGIYNVADPNGHVSTDRARRELGWQETLRA